MRFQGRLLRIAWGENFTAELGKLAVSPSTFGLSDDRTGNHMRLYDVFDYDGERILKDLGPPPLGEFGLDLNGLWTRHGNWYAEKDRMVD